MAESNSFYNGGAPNISNAYGSALWLLDFLLTLARGGAGGVNLHGGGNGPGYTPIADDGRAPVEVRPEYVAMLMFSRLAGGRMLPTRVATGGLNLAGGAVAMPDGTSRVLLVNKDGQGGTRIELPGWSAGLTRLTGPSLNSPSGVLLGGAPVGPDGHWAGREEPLRAAAGRLTFDLPPASAALVAIG